MIEKEKLQAVANRLRVQSIQATTAAGSGHPTTCMSAAELMAALFFHEMSRDDEFVLSKGHAAPLLWAVYAEAGQIDAKELLRLRKIDSVLEGHPTPLMPLVKVASGSLGQGLSVGVGMALAKRLQGNSGRVFVLMGDGESAEGSVWEAANSASYEKLGNLVMLVDINGLGQSQRTQHGHDLKALERKFAAFGWKTLLIDGHDVEAVAGALEKSRNSDVPIAILAKTLKGKGVSFLEDKEGWHGKPLKPEEMESALKEIPLKEVHAVSNARFSPAIPSQPAADFSLHPYQNGERVAVRSAFGNALVRFGREEPRLVAIDADVKNSTMMEGFFREFPDRAFQTFIAEQNMVGMAIGFSAMGFIPVISTFAAFLTRAYDFIRMAVYSRANLKIAGSHVGASIGPDGASQMGLEDISMFMPFPGVQILYPSDAVSTEACFKEMTRHFGISYLRMTREKTPVIYPAGEAFPPGGLKVLRSGKDDRALVIAAGFTLHEALKAYQMLREKGILIRVVDLYSLKPLPVEALKEQAADVSGKIYVVEDHYDFGMGTLVSEVIPGIEKLCVRRLPRSGSTQELMEDLGLSAAAIVEAVEKGIQE